MDKSLKSLMVGISSDGVTPQADLEVTPPTEEEGRVLDAMNKVMQRFRAGKSEQNIINQQCWAMYKDGVSGLINNLAGAAGVGGGGGVNVGWVKGDWRHQVHIPKAYENIMTISAYMRSAAFPNSRWMSLEPGNGESRFKASVFSSVMLQELKKAGFSEAINKWIFTAAVTGTSVLYFPWKKEERMRKFKEGYDDTYVSPDGLDIQKNRKTRVSEKMVTTYDNLKFKIADSTSFYLDSSCPDNPNDAPMIYRHRIHVSELMDMMRNGDIDRKLTPKEIELILASSEDSDNSTTEMALKGQNTAAESNREYLWLTEYFGDIVINGELRHDQHLIRSGDFLLRNGLSDYWCCNPYHVYRYHVIPGRTYGEGALEPVLRQLALLDLMTNQRLDAMELVVSGIWERLADSFTRKEDLVIAPNAIITVQSTGEVRQIPLDLRGINISAQDIQALEASIDKSMGIGNYVNAGSARSGERVTAEEVRTVQAAGGQRLTGVYMHFEEEGFEPLLMKLMQMYQQFVEEPRIIKLIGADKIEIMKTSMAETGSNIISDEGLPEGPDEEVNMAVGPEDLQGDFNVQARGADILADREKRLNEFTQAVAVNAQYPQGAVHMKDWDIVRGLWQRSGVDDWSEYIEQDYQTKKASEAQAGQPQADPNNGAPLPTQQDAGANALLGPLAQDPQQLAAVAGAGGLDPALSAISGGAVPSLPSV